MNLVVKELSLNQKFVILNLIEASEHLNMAIEAARNGKAGLFEALIPWVYRKVNAAWNSRELGDVEAMNMDTYETRCRMPSDLNNFFDPS